VFPVRYGLNSYILFRRHHVQSVEDYRDEISLNGINSLNPSGYYMYHLL
jgi:hypothetical protein